MAEPAFAEAARSAAIGVPASAEALGLIRHFAASIGRHADLPVEGVEDLKLALTEVCSAAIEGSRTDDDVVTVTASWHPDGTTPVVRVSASSSFTIGDAATDDRARLLAALGLKLRATDDDRGVEFSIPSSSSD